jgi:predicted ATP-grasp superfamily ATP-dependent carboligase
LVIVATIERPAVRTCEVVPAVVVGAGLNGLGVVRSLAAGGITTHVLGRPDGIAMRSRHGHKHGLAAAGGDALVHALQQLLALPSIEKGIRPVLFLTEESAVRTVSQRRAQILPHFRIALPDAGTLHALMDKTAFQALAQAAGGLIPPAVSLSCAADLPRLARLRYPAVLKPAYKHDGYGAVFQKAYVVGSTDEAAARWRDIAPVLPDLIVQEWIPGSDSDIYFCLQYIGDGGIAVASFVGRKLRSWPLRIGGTASCIAAPEHAAELSRLTLDFFHSVGFVGMGSMEYKRDPGDGRFYMIEPTVARTDFQEEVATLNGVNIPLAAFLHQVGAVGLPCKIACPARLWREPVTDRWAYECGTGDRPEASIAHIAQDAYFRLADPMPWLTLIWRRLVARWRMLRARASAQTIADLKGQA